MSESCVFITSPSQFQRFPDSKQISLRFVSLLTGIKYNGKNFILELSDFDNNNVISPYRVKLRCSDENAKRLAQMTISLLCQFFDFEIPELRTLSDPFFIDEIQLDRLCFINCKVIYIGKDDKYSLFLDDIKPIDLNNAIRIARQLQSTLEQRTILKIFDNLIKLNNESRNGFKFVKLDNYNNEFAQFIQEKQTMVNSRKKTTIINNNPLFRSHITDTRENEMTSQFDFNSQYLNTENSNDSTSPSHDSIDPIEESDANSSSIHLSRNTSRQSITTERSPKLRKLNKNSKPVANKPEYYRCVDIGTICEIQGKLVGSIPLNLIESNLNASPARFFFIPNEWTEGKEGNDEAMIKLLPNYNCIEVLVSKFSELKGIFSKFTTDFTKLNHFLLNNKVQVRIVRSKFPFKLLKNDTFHAYNKEHAFAPIWTLQDIDLLPSKIPKKKAVPRLLPSTIANNQDEDLNKILNQQFERTKNDSVIKFEELRLSPHEVKFVTMFGLLVSVTFENSQYVSLVFTDFTTNSIDQKYLFGNYLIDPIVRMNGDQGFRVIMYPEHFEIFNRNVAKVFGLSLIHI